MTTYKQRRYLLITTDPVHIGAGGYRLGRVDNSIVREPGARVPKIPGTSLHGAIRSYAAQLYATPQAAGQSQDEVNNPDLNPVCYTFGYIKKAGQDVKAYSGVVSIFDAQIALFPVHSLIGPLWVSTIARLRDAGFTLPSDIAEPETGTAWLTKSYQQPFNLGWLMMKPTSTVIAVNPPHEWRDNERWRAVQERIAIVNETLFSHIVNSNLEVRTSVAINPERGAAEDKALFTYEAIPRATFLTVEVVLDDYRAAFPSQAYLAARHQQLTEQLAKPDVSPEERKRYAQEQADIAAEQQHRQRLADSVRQWHDPLDVVQAGLGMLAWLGVGGMGTRGFGRIAIAGAPVEKCL